MGRNVWDEVPLGQYCVDGAMNFVEAEENDTSVVASGQLGHYQNTNQFSGLDEDTVMLVCTDFLEEPESEGEVKGLNIIYT